MKTMKRNGTEEVFQPEKIKVAVLKANESVPEHDHQVTDAEATTVMNLVTEKCEILGRTVQVEEIQDMVEEQLMRLGKYKVARNYITYRYNHALARVANSTDDKILSLIDCCNEEAKQENSNKNPVIASTQRDYMAGEVSKDITRRLLLPEDITEANDDGLIHFHDSDYFAQHMHNCCLVDLEDMLQNGTVITGTLIEKPHSFSTACNIATQIIAQIASNQYGGQTISMAHLAPFVEVSRRKIRGEVTQELMGIPHTQEDVMERKEKKPIVMSMKISRLRKGLPCRQVVIRLHMRYN